MLEQRSIPGILQPDVLGDGGRDQPWLPYGRQRNEVHAIGEIAVALRGQLQAEAGLSAAARAGQSEEAVATQEPSRLRQLLLPADEGREWAGQVVRDGVQSPGVRRRYLSLSDRSARHRGDPTISWTFPAPAIPRVRTRRRRMPPGRPSASRAARRRC